VIGLVDTMRLNGFDELSPDELFTTDAGGALAKSLWLTAGIVAAVWTPIVVGALVVSGVGAPLAVGVAIYGAGAATYSISKSTHS
jgi:hypothetical protein